jgi:branched-chain amino acid transport system substrate-binding protein
MEATCCPWSLRKNWALPLVSLLAVVAIISLAVACGEEEEATPTADGMGVPATATATASPTPAATASPTPTVTPVTTATVTATATPAPSRSPVAEGPGITDTEIILGADVPLSGAFGAVYATISQTTEAYFQYINDTQGGICGRQIVYKVEDNGDDPAKGMEVVRKLVEQDKVFAMVGSLGDGAHPGTWDYLNEKGVPDILTSIGSHMFGADPQGHPWTVQMIPSYRIEGVFFGQHISENLPGKKVGILYPNIIMGTDHLQGVKEGLDPDKNEIVSEQSYEITAISISSQVTNMKNAGAEVVTTNATPGFSAQAIKQADRLGWHPQWFLSYNNSDEMMFQFVSPELLEGAISFQALKLATWTDDPAVAEHYRIMSEYGGPSPTNFTIYAQTLAEVAVEALTRSCDNLTRQGLMDALESIEGFHSDLFLDEVNVSFSDTDHTGLQTGKMLRAVVEDGKGKFEYFGPLVEFE